MDIFWILLAAAIILLIVVILGRALWMRPKRPAALAEPLLAVDAGEAAAHLAGAIRIQTQSHLDHNLIDYSAFGVLHRYLQQTYPLVHQRLQREVVGDYSLLYTWAGQDPALKPILLMGHLDVVPIEDGTQKDWLYPPFAGEIQEGYIWGRGTMDDKNAVMGNLEAVEGLLRGQYQPQRTIYLAFGHDEEIGGKGAAQVAALLKERGISLECVLDEGLAIIDGVFPGFKQPFALVGVAEKGYLSLELSVTSAGGHAAMPPKETAIGLLSRAITRLEKHQMPARFQPPTSQMFATLAPAAPFAFKILLANLWLFKGLLVRVLQNSKTSSATIRTTTAPTIFQAGYKDNILPIQARAALNFRLLQGDSIASVIKHVHKVIADERVQVRPLVDFSVEPSPVSGADTPSFRILERVVAQIFPVGGVAPGLVTGATDSRSYAGISACTYRFSPLWVRPADLSRVHGTNERISVDNFARMVQFYAAFMSQMGG